MTLMKMLKLAGELALPLEAVTEKLAFLGRTGSGKTYAAMKLAELMLDAGAQIGAVDPVGVWRALRVPAEKGGPSFDVVVFGGLYGDLPIEPTEHAGVIVADLVCDRGLSFVLDVSQFIPSEQQRFVRAFGDRFFHRRKSAPSAVHLFLEECQEFIPENPSGDEAKTLGVMQRLWKLGRNFGIGGSLISQRPQEIAKKALNMSGTLFAFQMTGPQERKAVKLWVADHGVALDIEAVLQKLRVGEPHVESPTFLEVSKTVQVLSRVTADLSSTPKVGSSTAAKRPLTPIDVEQLKTALEATIERAKQDDPKELKKRLAEKDRRIKDLEKEKGAHSLPAEKEKPVPILTAADRELLQALREDFQTFSTDIGARAEGLLGSMVTRAKAEIDDAAGRWTAELEKRRALFLERLEKVRVQRILDKLDQVSAPRVVIPRNAPGSARSENNIGKTARSAVSRNSPLHASGDATLSRMERAMLIALAQHPEGLTKKKIRVHTGYADSGPVSSTFATLLSSGWAAAQGDRLVITDDGLTVLGPFDPLPLGDALREHLMNGSGLSPMAKALLRVICNVYPNDIAKGEAREAARYADSGPVSSAFALLVGRDYVTTTGRGRLRAADELFG